MLRYEILDYLKRLYPRWAEETEIFSVFYQYHQVSEIKRDLYYLVDKGYVERKEVEIPYRRYNLKNLFKLTPLGIDLLECRIKDPAIPIPEE